MSYRKVSWVVMFLMFGFVLLHDSVIRKGRAIEPCPNIEVEFKICTDSMPKCVYTYYAPGNYSCTGPGGVRASQPYGYDSNPTKTVQKRKTTPQELEAECFTTYLCKLNSDKNGCIPNLNEMLQPYTKPHSINEDCSQEELDLVGFDPNEP